MKSFPRSCEGQHNDERARALYDKLPLPTDRLSIRLLRLRSGAYGDLIRCRMFCRSVANSPDFEALSYTWGVSKERREITVNGSTISVTVNLALALRGLRHEHKDRILWIDALCINQHDLQERGAQVDEMGQIFGAAHQVVIWLGLSEDTFQWDRQPDQDALSDMDAYGPDYIRRKFGRAPMGGRTAHSKIYDGVLRGAFKYMLSQRWWSRVWVVQEVARASRDPLVVLSHEWYLHWSDFINLAIQHAAEHTGALFRMSEIRSMVRTPPRLRENGSMSEDLLKILALGEVFDATDPRDKVFALWTMVRSTRGQWPKADYTKSVGEVYSITTQAAIEGVAGLDILLRCRRRTRRATAPTWVPDYSQMQTLYSAPLYPRWDFLLQDRAEPKKAYVRNGKLHAHAVVLGDVCLKQSYEATVPLGQSNWQRKMSAAKDCIQNCLYYSDNWDQRTLYPNLTFRIDDEKLCHQFAEQAVKERTTNGVQLSQIEHQSMIEETITKMHEYSVFLSGGGEDRAEFENLILADAESRLHCEARQADYGVHSDATSPFFVPKDSSDILPWLPAALAYLLTCGRIQFLKGTSPYPGHKVAEALTMFAISHMQDNNPQLDFIQTTLGLCGFAEVGNVEEGHTLALIPGFSSIAVFKKTAPDEYEIHGNAFLYCPSKWRHDRSKFELQELRIV